MTYEYTDMQIYVSNLMRDRETDEVEFKSAKGGVAKEFLGDIFRFCQHSWWHHRARCEGER